MPQPQLGKNSKNLGFWYVAYTNSSTPMEEIYQKIAEFNPQRPKQSSEVVTQFEVTELWHNEETGIVNACDVTVPVQNVPTWLDLETRLSNAGEVENLVLRLVWPEFNMDEHRVDLPGAVKQLLLTRFGLELAYDYFPSCLAGASAFPRVVKPEGDEQAFAFCYLPKIAAIWSHTRFKPPLARQCVTNGIILAQKHERDDIKNFLNSKRNWQLPIASHDMFPALLCSLMLHRQIEFTQGDIKNNIQAVEGRTGYTDFKTKRKHLATGELADVAAKITDYSSRLASTDRKSKTLKNLMEFTQRTINSDQRVVSEGDKIMKNHIQVLQDRLKMQIVDREYTLKRAQIQNEVLLSLMSMNYSLSNTLISISTLRDAASMKTLAFVTMFFLPGSFISALFSTDVFDWEGVKKGAIGVPATPQFGLYWAITIPLTVVTFLLYFLWAECSSYERSQKREWKKWENWGLSSSESLDSEQSQSLRETFKEKPGQGHEGVSCLHQERAGV
ncbi:hypothetical protein CEP52_013707 [Fusarium oligoseptatum]|uniref:Uncharacterized protein n=1 Tax=Fusarium oligoseptatum TaxID=2604345 RepID=A0A428SS57_9HYPO|nr:hypothetical protein CEP52_013707 [Fusarium oligoseptatum]